MIIRIGDVFQVNISDENKKFIQYIADDFSYMNSIVIRVFKKSFEISQAISIERIINLPIDFYAHTSLKNEIKNGKLIKTGNIKEIGSLDVWFRDYLNPIEVISDELRIAKNWRIWKVNHPFMNVVDEDGRYEEYDRGGIIPFAWIIKKMIDGNYHFVYPSYSKYI